MKRKMSKENLPSYKLSDAMEGLLRLSKMNSESAQGLEEVRNQLYSVSNSVLTLEGSSCDFQRMKDLFDGMGVSYEEDRLHEVFHMREQGVKLPPGISNGLTVGKHDAVTFLFDACGEFVGTGTLLRMEAGDALDKAFTRRLKGTGHGVAKNRP